MRPSFKRINVTFDTTTRAILEQISSTQNRSLSEVVRNITEEWLEIYEDRYWVETATQDLQGPFLTHEEVFKDV
jgi:hypothetical protein